MHESFVKFRITNLQACVREGVAVRWQGKEFNTGPINIEIDSAADTGNKGSLDYGAGRAQAEFHVLLAFPEFASTLGALGVDSELTRPVHAVIHSEGEILDNHSFVLSGACDLADHALLNRSETKAFVLPGT